MKTFRFQKFDVLQSANVFRVGTDAVLLGALSDVEGRNTILEIGCGTGIISLMVAQRNPEAKITAIDINEEAANLANENFKNSIFKSRLKAIPADFKKFKTIEKFDLILSNPPYFEPNDSVKDISARQMTELNFEELILGTKENLSQNGNFFVILPVEARDFFIKTAWEHGFFLNRKINIKGIEHSKVKRLILGFSFHEELPLEGDFTIQKSPRQYSDGYLELTKDFHIFTK